MAKLAELQALVSLARKLGQQPSTELLEHIARLERDEQQRLQREAAMRARIAEDIDQLFSSVPVVETTLDPEPDPATPAEPATAMQETVVEPQAPEPAVSNVDVVKDYIARNNVKESIVAPDPVLAQPQRDLEREIRYLREWVGRIAATGAGSGEVNFRWLDDVDRSSINKNWFLNYEPSTKKFTFVDTRVSTEAFDRTSSIALTTTPALLRPNSSTNVKNMTYNSSTGVFTFLRECEVTLAITLNALATASNQRVFQYAERNTGTGWTVIANSGKSFQLTNGAITQIVNAQTISRLAGEQIRYFIYTDGGKVDLITETLSAVTSGTVYVPAIRIQYAGR